MLSITSIVEGKSASSDRLTLSKHAAMLKASIFKKSHIGDAVAGIVTVFGIDILIIFIALLLNIISPIFMSVFFSIGLIQLIYVLPLLRWSMKRRVKGFTKGLILGALTIASINLACFLVILKFF